MMKNAVVFALICCHLVMGSQPVLRNESETITDTEPFQGLKPNLMFQVLKRLDEIDQRISHLERRIQNNHHLATGVITEKLEGISDKLESINKTLRQNVGTYYGSCLEAPARLSDVYTIKPPASSIAPFQVYCEQSYRKGGWIVLSRRFDGTVKTALYDEFEVGNEATGYRLHLGEFVEGNAKDSLRISVGMKFSTPDRDNDEHTGSCAEFYASGWWFRNCMNANLNGVHRKFDAQNSTMNWFGFRDDLQGLKESSMMIREVPA
uniref:Fibrinogen C-terminal domain-containing protein n=1 Tax=Anopheles funestus TaxID=62324 RepID=A0A182RLM3_ANOFN